MEISGFTFIAQIINFLILVGLLHHFLYGPITRMMNRRQQMIQSSLQSAADKLTEAERQAAFYQQQLHTLETQREQMLSQARKEVEQHRQELLRQMRQALEEQQVQWYVAIQRERSEFLQALRQRLGQEITTVLRRMLTDLANTDLEYQMSSVFLERLQHLTAKQQQEMAQSLMRSPMVKISSAFELPDASRQSIVDFLHQQFSPQIAIQFETVPELICGILLRTPTQEIAWAIPSYLESLENNLLVALEQEMLPHDEPRSATEIIAP